MEPAALTLLLQALFVLLVFGWRTVAQLRETGGTGFFAHRERGLQDKAASLALTVGLIAGLLVTWRRFSWWRSRTCVACTARPTPTTSHGRAGSSRAGRRLHVSES